MRCTASELTGLLGGQQLGPSGMQVAVIAERARTTHVKP
jgi:hypothetical protein